MRIALESMAARIAASKWTEKDTRTDGGEHPVPGARRHARRISHLDVEMHEYVVRLAGHRRLLSAWRGIRWQFEMCLAYTHRLQQTLDFEPRRITVDSHRRLLAALASGDPELAAKTMAAHIEGSLEWSLAKFPVNSGDSAGRPTATSGVRTRTAIVSGIFWQQFVLLRGGAQALQCRGF